MQIMSFFPRLIPLISICLAAQFLGGCFFSPQRVVQYRATAEGSTWDQGVELHPAKTERLDLRMGFLENRLDPAGNHTRGQPLYFRIEAANVTDTAVLLDPVDFRIAIPGTDSQFAALDPEAILYETRKDLASEDARYGGELGTAAIENVASLGIDILSLFAKQTPEEKLEWEKTKDDSRHHHEDQERRHEEAVERLTGRERFWADSTLRKTTLAPGGRLAGRIGFGAPYGRTPDSLVLQYRERSGAFTDLVGYGIVRDAAETARAVKRKSPQGTHKTYFGAY